MSALRQSASTVLRIRLVSQPSRSIFTHNAVLAAVPSTSRTASSSSMKALHTLGKRYFSTSPLLRAGRPNWYSDRPVKAIRSGPLQKLQASIDKRIPRSYLLYGIIGANVAVFGAWWYATETAKKFRDFGPLSFMYKNFASSWANLSRPWTLITSCFSHQDTSHIFVNLFSFYFLAPAALSILTASQFIGLYLAAGLAGSVVQLGANLFQQRPGPSFGLGASGAINGVLTFFACAFPYQKIVLMLVIPMPAWVAVAGIVSYDMYIALRHPNGGVGAAAHLGGAAAGALFFRRMKALGRFSYL